MKSISGYITKLLRRSLLITIILLMVLVIFSLVAWYFWWIEDDSIGTTIIIILPRVFLFTFLPFILLVSLPPYLNVNRKRRGNSFRSFASFVFLPLICTLSYVFMFLLLLTGFESRFMMYFPLSLSPDSLVLSFLYTIYMIVNYILFRRFCRRELGE